MQQAAGFSVVRFTSLDGIQGEKGRKGGEPTFSQRKCSCGFEMFVFHSCGWRFSGFSEVNAGSAPCHQIRFTVTLATVFTAHWLPQLPATVQPPGGNSGVGDVSTDIEVPLSEIIALQSTVERDSVLSKGGRAGVGQDWLREFQSPAESSHSA